MPRACVLRSRFRFALVLPGLSLAAVAGASVLWRGIVTCESHSVVSRRRQGFCENS